VLSAPWRQDESERIASEKRCRCILHHPFLAQRCLRVSPPCVFRHAGSAAGSVQAKNGGEPPEPLGPNTKVNMGAQHTNRSTSDVEPPIHSHTQRVLESRLAGASEAVKLSTLGTWARKLRYLAVLHRGSHPLLPFFFSRYFSPHVFSTSPHARPQEGSSHQLRQAVYAVVLTKAHNTSCNFR